ncbi:MAG TPA: ABC transporter permease [Vicinamibacterales bacterium]
MGTWSRIRRTFRAGSHHAEIDEELRFHLEMDAADHGARDARLRLGNVARIAEDTRAAGIVEWIESSLRDALYGLRQLRKTPALTVAVIASLAIGIGANSAIFTLIDAAILKPLPVNDPDSLVIVEWTNDGFPPGATNINGDFREIAGGRLQGSSVNANLHRRLAREQHAFAAIAGVADPVNVAIAVGGAQAEQVSAQYVSANFFQGVGAAPIVGRPFDADEDRVGHEPVAIVSHRLWVTRFGSDRSVLDRAVRINNVPVRIVGVAPPGFFGLMAGQWTDVYAPLAARVAFSPPSSTGARSEDDSDWWVRQIARLDPGMTEEASRIALDGLFRGMVVPDGAAIEPSHIPILTTHSGRRGFAALNPRDASALWILLLLVGVLLLIVCANVANLLLSRSVSRQRESAVRLALGASRARLFRQYLIESGLLALAGGAAGVAVGFEFAREIHLLFQTGRDASNAFDLNVDWRTLTYAFALAIGTAVLFGLAPAVRAARSDFGDVLKAQTRSVIGGRLRLPRMLVAIQLALCLAALVAAGLLGRSLANLKWTDIGFDRENLAYASVNPSRAGYSRERIGPFGDRVRGELSRLPGVARVSAVSFRFLAGMGNNGLMNFAGRPLDQGNRANMNSVGEGFFETVGIPLVAGRTIDARDIRQESGAVVVDEMFAKRFFPNESPLGRRFGLGFQNNSQYEIVGVVGNSRYNTLREEMYPTMYEAFRPSGTIHFAIRTTMDPARLREAVRRTIASVDAAVPVTEFHTQSALIDRHLRTERLLGILSGAFGVLALALAAIGLAGLLAYAVARRTNEIGIRMAVGADRADVIRMVLRESLGLCGVGLLLGIPCAYAVARFLRTALFQLEPLDPRTAVFALATLLTVALAAAWIPARRAASIDPIAALRDE